VPMKSFSAVLLLCILCLFSCSKKQDNSWFSGNVFVIPFPEIQPLKCYHDKSGGLLIKDSMVNSMVSDAGLRLSLEDVDGKKVCVLSFYGVIHNDTADWQKLRLFKGQAGDLLMTLPTVSIAEPNLIYYRDAAGLHKIAIEPSPGEQQTP
jgi:hypothetical protein